MEQRCLSCMQMIEGDNCPYCGYPAKVTNESHQLAVGTMLRNRYQIGKVLGQGGFGITYVGWDTLMRRTVAVKEFYPSGTVFRRTAITPNVECGTDVMVPHYEYSKARFLREASALVDFKDIPGVVDILDFIEENNTAYIVMEYVRGVDLAKYSQMRGGKLSVEETFRILKPVMEALAKVHRGGIVHRDISPDNIILDPMGGAKLLDFGAVRSVEDPDVEKGLNKSTEAILKQGFAPIEQYNTRGNLGPWTDEYAMCATVWYCLTGKVPEEASIRMSEGVDVDWSSIEGLPVHQQKALEKGFSCRAKDRYPSIDELLADLFPETAPEVSEPVPEPVKQIPVAPVNEKPEAPKKRGKLGWVFVAAAVVAIAVIAAVILPKVLDPKTPEDGPVIQGPGPAGTTTTVTDPTETDPTETDPTETDPAETDPVVTEPLVPPTDPTEKPEPPTEPEPLSPEEEAYLRAEELLAEGKLGEAAIAFAKLNGFSDSRNRSFSIWATIAQRDLVSAGGSHTVGIKADGTVMATGWNSDGRCNVGGWSDMEAVSAGDYHTVGLVHGGTVVATGWNDYGQCDVSGWTDIVAISAGYVHTVGLRADGTVVAVGGDPNGQCDVSGWTNIVAIDAGGDHTVGLRADGTVVATGSTSDGRCDVSGWSDIVAISAGESHTIGLKADGTVVATGLNGSNQCNVGSWSDIIAISAGYNHTEGLKADGTVVTTNGTMAGTNKWSDIVAISAGWNHVIGIKANGTVVATGNNPSGQCDVGNWTNVLLPIEHKAFR